MEDSSSIFPKASEMLIHSGNIVNWNRLTRRLKQTPEEEVNIIMTMLKLKQ